MPRISAMTMSRIFLSMKFLTYCTTHFGHQDVSTEWLIPWFIGINPCTGFRYIFYWQKKKTTVFSLRFFLSSRLVHVRGASEERSARKPCCFNKACPSKITGMSLRDPQETIVSSPLLRPAAATSPYPEDPPSSKKVISRTCESTAIILVLPYRRCYMSLDQHRIQHHTIPAVSVSSPCRTDALNTRLHLVRAHRRIWGCDFS